MGYTGTVQRDGLCRADRSPQQKWRDVWVEYEDIAQDQMRDKLSLPARGELCRWADDGGRA